MIPTHSRFVAAALAIVPRFKVEQILQSLDEIGVSISPQRVMELRCDPIFLQLHRPRTCTNDSYSIEELKEHAALAVIAAAAVRSGLASQRANKLETDRTHIIGSDCETKC